MLDLMHLARTGHEGGDLFSLLEDLYEPADVRPTGYPDAVVWQDGNHDGGINPIAHSLTFWACRAIACRCGRSTGTTTTLSR